MKKPVIKFIISLSIGFTLISTNSCKEERKEVIVKPITIDFKKEGNLTLYKSTSDSIITRFDIEIAVNDYEIQRGLMDRNSMKDTQAMLFIFPDINYRSFYMKNTYIPLDIIYIDDNGYIVSFQENAKPLDETSLPSQVPAKYVLEINAGLAQKWLLEIGDKMVYTNH